MARELILSSPHRIGDTLMATPAIRSWKRAHPSGRVTVCCRDEGGPYQVLLHNPHIDALRVVDGDDGAARYRGTRIPLDPESAFKWSHLNHHSLAQGYGRLLGVEIDGPRYDYVVTAEERAEAGRACQALGRGKPIVVVARHSVSCLSNHPAIGQANKCVDNACWLACAEALIERGYVPVAVGSREEEDDARFRSWPGAKLYGEPLRRVAAICARSAGVLTVDNGIRHLAAAAGAHLYTLSGAIPLWQIACAPVREGQRICEVHRPLADVDARTLLLGAQQLGL
jgi:ADP-heptose:LPS heptosyltransferase